MHLVPVVLVRLAHGVDLGGFYVYTNVAMIVLPWTIVSVFSCFETGALLPACFVLIMLGDV